MSKTIVLELEDADYERLLQEARAAGRNVEELAAQRLRPVPTSLPEVATRLLSPNPVQEAKDAAYPQYPGWDALRPEVQQVAQALAARHGGEADAYARAWWEKMAPRILHSLTPEEGIAGEDPLVRHFGTINSGDRQSGDNDRIDADLARYYLRELDGNEDAA